MEQHATGVSYNTEMPVLKKSETREAADLGGLPFFQEILVCMHYFQLCMYVFELQYVCNGRSRV